MKLLHSDSWSFNSDSFCGGLPLAVSIELVTCKKCLELEIEYLEKDAKEVASYFNIPEQIEFTKSCLNKLKAKDFKEDLSKVLNA